MPLATCLENLAGHFEKMDAIDRKHAIWFVERLIEQPHRHPQSTIAIQTFIDMSSGQPQKSATVYQFARPARTRRNTASKSAEVTA